MNGIARQAIDPAIAGFYEQTPEEDRLGQGAFLLEQARTRELIGRFAPPAPAAVGGRGRRRGRARSQVRVHRRAGPAGWPTPEPTDRLDYFTTAYFHHPKELAEEGKAAGLAVNGVYGIEGPGWILPDIEERMADDRRRAALLDVARMVETEPAMVGTSAHLLLVAQRPETR